MSSTSNDSSSPRSRRLRSSILMFTVGALLAGVGVARSQGAFVYPEGFHVLRANTPARASDLMDNFQHVLKRLDDLEATDVTAAETHEDLDGRVADLDAADATATADRSALRGRIDGLSVSCRRVTGSQVSGDDQRSYATCAADEFVASCSCYSPWQRCDGAFPSGRTCVAQQGQGGNWSKAEANCCRLVIPN